MAKFSFSAPSKSTLTPTDEQAEAIRLFKEGKSIVINAGAGCGKSSTLKMLAETTNRRGQYTAFNRAIVDTAKEKFEDLNVAVNTAHSLAWGALGKNYSHRLGTARIKLSELAKRLRIKPISLMTPYSAYEKVFPDWRLAGFARAAVNVFCQSADVVITVKHFPFVEGVDHPGDFTNHNALAEHLLRASKEIWADAQDKNGWGEYTHAYYLKQWSLTDPKLDADYILGDEQQDTAPVFLHVLQCQKNAQLVIVGDACQEVYGWTGAINALDKFGIETKTTLSTSFRFGQKIADEANRILSRLPQGLKLKGNGTESLVGPLNNPKCILSRTNAVAVMGILNSGGKGYLIGGGEDVIKFAEGAEGLRAGKKAIHPDLACFDTWAELEAYIEDEVGADLKLLVKLVKRFGGYTIAKGLRSMPSISKAETIYSTAHRSKGLEWESVKLADDFPGYKTDPFSRAVKLPNPAELRLIYVALTRAQTSLDKTRVEILK